VLDAAVPGATIEGRVRSCSSDVPPEQCFDARSSGSQLRVSPASFSSPAGNLVFTGDVPDAGCFPAEDVYVVAEVTVIGSDDTRRGPFFTPIVSTHVDAHFVAVVTPHIARIDLLALPGGATSPVEFQADTDCGFPVVAQSDADWLSVGYKPGYSDIFVATADPTKLDPSAGPFSATITLGAQDPPLGTATIPVTLTFAALDLHWATPPPERVGTGQTFPLALTVGGDFVSARVQLDAGYAGSDRLFTLLTFAPGATLTGPPGDFNATGMRGTDCDGPIDAELRSEVWITGTDGIERGPVPFTPAPFEATRSTVAQTLGSAVGGTTAMGNNLHFRTVRGGLPMPRDVSLWLACPDRGPARVDWTATVDVPWLQLSDTTGELTPTQSVIYPVTTLSVDPTGLDPAGSLYTGHLTFTAPGTGNSPLVLPVDLDITGDIAVDWTTAPATIAPGESFPLALAVTGNFDQVAGRALDCDSSVEPFCLFDFSSYAVDLTNAGFFAGPPGTFAFEGTRFANCFGLTHSFFGATFTIARDGSLLGPFYATPSPVLEPIATTYSVLPSAITLRGLAGQSPLAATLSPLWICGGALDWTAQVNRPWMGLTAVAGQTGFRVRDTITVVVDTGTLDPAGSPYDGSVTFGLAGSAMPVATVPVHVEIVAPGN
jgi:hypothetical protein